MANLVADYVGTRKYLDPAILDDLEEMVSGMVADLISGKLKAGSVTLNLAGALDKEDNPEFTLSVTSSNKRSRKYKLGKARQMSLFQPGES